MNVLYGVVYSEDRTGGIATFNLRMLESLRHQVGLTLLVADWPLERRQHPPGDSSVRLETHHGLPAIRIEVSRHIDRCTAPGDSRHMDRFIDLLADAMTRSRVDVVHMAEWEGGGADVTGRPRPGLAIFAAADKAGIPWVVAPVDYRLACPAVWLFEQRAHACSGPDATFDKCAHCVAVPASALWSPRRRLALTSTAEALYRVGLRRLAPGLLTPPLPRYFTARQWRRRAEAIRRQLQSCRAIVTMSEKHARVLQELLGLPPELFVVLYHPAPTPSADAAASPQRFSPPLRFAWVQRLGPEWAPSLLLEGWRRAGLSRDQARLCVYSTTDMRRWARSAGYGDLLDSGSVELSTERVQGREEQVFAGMAAHVATYLWEANGVGYDQLALRVPLVYPRGTVLGELYEDGVHGFAYTQGDPSSLGGLLRRLTEEPHLLEQTAERMGFRPEYGFTAAGQKLLALYERIVASKAAAPDLVHP